MADKKGGSTLLADVLASVSTLGTDAQGREQIEYIDIDHIHPDERNFYALDGIEELAANIEFTGLQQPLRVRPDPDHEGEYIISSGHRRHAALCLLVDSGNEKFRPVPSIVERDAGADGEAASLLQELRLIYANSDTRKMSSADVSKQAERVEMLLYQLKEAGVEFPGRMRDHVAEACKVSKSKLSRLKVIRENLGGEMKEQWLLGKLNESEAYELAKMPPEHRALVWAHKGGHSWNYSGATAVETYGKRLKSIDASPVPKDCPAGGTCENRAGRREKSFSDSIYCISRCEECCHGCPYIVTCKHACHLLADEIAEAKQARKAEREAEKERTEEAYRPDIELLTRLWRRFGTLLSADGVDLEELNCKCRYWTKPTDSQKFFALADGVKAPALDDPTPLGFQMSRRAVNVLLELADTFGVSIDYLLCRTDDPNPVPTSGTAPTWQTGTPTQAGVYYCLINCGGARLHDVLSWDAIAGLWRFRQGAGVDAEVLSWYPLPPTDEEAGEHG